MTEIESLKILVFDPVEIQAFMDSLNDIDQQIVADAIANLVPRAKQVSGGWIKRLPQGLLQLRIGPTRQRVLKMLQMPPPPLGQSDGRLLVRVFFIFHQNVPVLLCAYDKAADSSRATQQRLMSLARERQNSLAKSLDK